MPSRLPVPHPSRRPKQQCRETRSKFSSMLPTVLISSLSVTEVTGMLLGSVSGQILAYAHCPTVIVRA